MTALLQHLVRVRSQAAEDMLAYLEAMLQQMRANKLLERFGRKLDDLRVPLRVVAYEPISDFDTVRLRENLRLEPGQDDDDEKAQRRVYAQRGAARDEEDEKDKAARPQPEPLEQLEPTLKLAVLLGDPGSGKTEWLKYLAYRAASEAYRQLKEFEVKPDDLFLPAFLRLSDIAAHLRQADELKDRLLKLGAIATLNQVPTIEQRVAAAMLNALVSRHKLTERLVPLVWQKWFTAASTPHSLLCLDAWDEARASDEEKQDLANCLTAFAKAAQARIFLTSRIIGYSHKPLPVESKAEGDRRELQILPFDWNETDQFVTSFFADDPPRGQQMLTDLRGKIAVAGMAQNPLLATLLCMAFSPSPGRPPLEFPTRRVEVYERVLEGLLGEWAAEQKGETPDWELIEEKILLLEEMAYHFFPNEKLDRKELRFFLRDHKKGYLKNLDDDNPIRLMLKDKRTTITRELSKDGAIVPLAGNQSGDFIFLHLTFQEYLTACALARRAKPQNGGWARIKDFVDAKSWAPEWEEVIILMAGRLDDPVPLFDLLGDAERDDIMRFRLSLLARCLPELSNSGHQNFSRALRRR